MRLRFAVAIPLLLLAFQTNHAVGQQPMSPEQEIVRRTYARLSFASQINEIHDMLRNTRGSHKDLDRDDFKRRMQFGTIQFELSNFNVGAISRDRAKKI